MSRVIQKDKLVVLAVIALILVLIIGYAVFITNGNPSQLDNTVILAINSHPASALIFIAEEKGFFNEEGLIVKSVNFQTGKQALDSLLGGGADIATTADVPISLAAMSGQSFKVISTIGWSKNDVQVVARKTSNILSPADLRGKRIGTTSGNGPHFFVYSFLKVNGIALSDVQLTFLQPSDMVSALERNDLDAIIIFDQYIFAAKQRLGDNAVVFAPSNIYGETWNIVASQSFLEKNPQKAEKFLRALLKAENYMATHKEEMLQITAKYANSDTNIISQILGDWTIEIGLGPILTDSLIQESLWASTNGISKGKSIQDFNAWIDDSLFSKAKSIS